MKLFGSKKSSPEPAKRVTDAWPLTANGVPTTYGEMRFHATNLATTDYRNEVEQGLAMSILAILDDIEQRTDNADRKTHQ